MPNLIEMIVLNILQIGGAPTLEGDEKSAYNNVQVGGAPT